MQNNKIAPVPGTSDAKELPSDPEEASPSQEELKGVARIWEGLVRFGLGETTLRVGTSVLTISLFLVVIWIMGNPTSSATVCLPFENFNISVSMRYKLIARNAEIGRSMRKRCSNF